MGVGKDETVNNQISDSRKKRSDISPSLEMVKVLNPFEDGFEVLGVRREMGYYRDSGGNYQKNTFVSEKHEKTSLYITAENKEVLMGLGASGMRLFIWLCYTIKPRQDKYWLNVPKFMREANISLNTVKSGIKELIDAGVIALSDVKGIYFVNPRFLFRGNRVDVYEDLVRVIDSRVSLEKREDKGDEEFTNDINNIF
jgi:hypothetical protein